MKKHIWTLEEELICCRKFIDFSANPQKNEITFEDIISKIATYLSHIDNGEISTKLQEIKHVSVQYYLFDSLPIEPLEQHSRQCEIALKAAIGDAVCEAELSNHPPRRTSFGENIDYPIVCQEDDDDLTKFGDFFTDDK